MTTRIPLAKLTPAMPATHAPAIVRNLLGKSSRTAKFSLIMTGVALFGAMMTYRYFKKIIGTTSSSEQKRFENNARNFTVLTCAALGLTLVSSLALIFNANK